MCFMAKTVGLKDCLYAASVASKSLDDLHIIILNAVDEALSTLARGVGIGKVILDRRMSYAMITAMFKFCEQVC
ncbi:MAG: hypothetical protein QG632_416 [Candidatus Dependentiae bacterium]|nr:hypothetical protein [Candidatus Dependentiae bacterium]